MLSLKAVPKVLILGLFSVLFFYTHQSHAEDWVYTVRQGDTLWELCKEYTEEEDCWLQIDSYNGVVFPRSLKPGTRIKFPVEWLKSQPATVELVYVNGIVNIKAKVTGVRHAGVTGETLGMGAVVQTGPNSSATLKFADGAVLVMESDSEIVFDSLSQNGHTGMVDSKVRLLHGTTSAKVPVREPKSNFSVTSPSAVAAVRGTDFRVSTDDSEKMLMLGSVYEGVIAVSDHKNVVSVPVKQGFGVKAEKGQPIGQPQKLLTAPKFMTRKKRQFFPLKIDWKDVSGSKSYVVEVLEDAEDDKLIELISSEKSEVVIPIAENGCFRIRVSASDKDGLKGMPGEIRLCGKVKLDLAERDTNKDIFFFFMLMLLAAL